MSEDIDDWEKELDNEIAEEKGKPESKVKEEEEEDDWEKELDEEMNEKKEEKSKSKKGKANPQPKAKGSKKQQAKAAEKPATKPKEKASQPKPKSEAPKPKQEPPKPSITDSYDPFAPSTDEPTETKPTISSLDTANPSTPDEFNEYANLLIEKLKSMSGNPNFMEFFKNVCKGVFDSEKKPDRVKELSDLFLVMNNQLIQVNKNKKKNKTKKPNVGKLYEDDDYDYKDEYDDFL